MSEEFQAGQVDPLNKLISQKYVSVAFITLLTLVVLWQRGMISGQSYNKPLSIDDLYNNRISNVVITVSGEIIKKLPDDNKGDRHQRFIIRSGSYSILVAHNLDVSERIPAVIGDKVTIKGEYEWNEKGGILHWTHRDKKNKHENGWIIFKNNKYQ